MVIILDFGFIPNIILIDADRGRRPPLEVKLSTDERMHKHINATINNCIFKKVR